MVRLAILALAGMVLSSFTLVTGRAVAQASRQRGFDLLTINGRNPDKTFQYRGEEAKRLIRELTPVLLNDVTSVSVREVVSLPGNAYRQLQIDVALNVRPWNNICEERHAVLLFSYQGQVIDLGQRYFTIKDGTITDHAFSELFWSNRYVMLPEKDRTSDAALLSCRALSADTSNWRHSSNPIDFRSEMSRLSALISAVETLPMSRIHCVDPQGKPCSYERSKLLSLLQTAPPEQSESLLIPNEGKVTVYRHYGYQDADPVDYVVTLRSGKLDLRSLDIRLSESLPPPAI